MRQVSAVVAATGDAAARAVRDAGRGLMGKDDWQEKTPTNRQAAKRPYCAKHSRAMLDIGGKKQCPACIKEAKALAADGTKPTVGPAAGG